MGTNGNKDQIWAFVERKYNEKKINSKLAGKGKSIFRISKKKVSLVKKRKL